MKKKLQLIDFSILLTFGAALLPLLFRNLGREAGSFAFLWAPISLLTIIGTHPNNFIKGSMRLLLLYGIIMTGILQYTLWSYMDDWNRPRILAEFYFLVIMVAILNYYRYNLNFVTLAWLSKMAFVFILISMIATNIALYIDINIVRQAADTAEFSSFQDRVFKQSGVMGYSYIQAIILLIPILVYFIKMKQRLIFSSRMLIIILVLIIITEIRAQVFANILAAVLVTILSLLGTKNMRASILIMIIVVILAVAIPSTYFANLLTYASNYFNPESEIYYKLNDFSFFIQNPEIDTSTGAGARAERYPLLFEALIANPIFGHASNISRLDILAGAHLYWMNRLAIWGIPGFIFFLITLYQIFRSISSLFDKTFRYYYFLSIVGFIFLGATKAVGGNEPWLILLVLIPGLYFQPLLRNEPRSLTPVK